MRASIQAASSCHAFRHAFDPHSNYAREAILWRVANALNMAIPRNATRPLLFVDRPEGVELFLIAPRARDNSSWAGPMPIPLRRVATGDYRRLAFASEHLS